MPDFPEPRDNKRVDITEEQMTILEAYLPATNGTDAYNIIDVTIGSLKEGEYLVIPEDSVPFVVREDVGSASTHVGLSTSDWADMYYLNYRACAT